MATPKTNARPVRPGPSRSAMNRASRIFRALLTPTERTQYRLWIAKPTDPTVRIAYCVCDPRSHVITALKPPDAITAKVVEAVRRATATGAAKSEAPTGRVGSTVYYGLLAGRTVGHAPAQERARLTAEHGATFRASVQAFSGQVLVKAPEGRANKAGKIVREPRAAKPARKAAMHKRAAVIHAATVAAVAVADTAAL